MGAHWDYRIIREHGEFSVVEAHYNDRGEIYSYGEPHNFASGGASLHDLRTDLRLLCLATRSAVITPADVIGVPPWEDEPQPATATL